MKFKLNDFSLIETGVDVVKFGIGLSIIFLLIIELYMKY